MIGVYVIFDISTMEKLYNKSFKRRSRERLPGTAINGRPLIQTLGSMRNVIFYLGMGALFTHELDAVAHQEWRVLPLLNSLPENLAFNVFVLAHVPLFAIAIAAVASSKANVRKKAKIIIAGFLLLHGLLHQLFSGHTHYEFFSLTSLVLIFGGALLGTLYLVMELWSKVKDAT